MTRTSTRSASTHAIESCWLASKTSGHPSQLDRPGDLPQQPARQETVTLRGGRVDQAGTDHRAALVERGEQRTVGAVTQPIGALAAHPGRRRRPRHAPVHRQRAEKRQLPFGRPAVVARARRTMRIGRVVVHVPAWNIIAACRTGISAARLRRECRGLHYMCDYLDTADEAVDTVLVP